MILLLDAGNSFIKWAWLEPAWLAAEPVELPSLIDAGELLHAGEDLQAALEESWSSLPVPSEIWLANVAGPVLASGIQEWVERNWHCPLNIAVSQARSGNVISAYTDPSQLGIDRWLALLAVDASHTTDSCIIDCGSAITVDALAASGQHMGGLILPGLRMMRDALYTGADNLVEAPATDASPDLLFASNTRTAVEVGSLYAIVAFIERIESDMKNELDAGFACILTGGDAEELFPLLSIPVQLTTDIVLQGMALYVRREKSEK